MDRVILVVNINTKLQVQLTTMNSPTDRQWLYGFLYFRSQQYESIMKTRLPLMNISQENIFSGRYTISFLITILHLAQSRGMKQYLREFSCMISQVLSWEMNLFQASLSILDCQSPYSHLFQCIGVALYLG